MKGFLPWLGGKHNLAKTIVGHIRCIEHTCYVEPFMGGAHVFFRREPAPAEVINDINSDLVTLFRVLQHHLEEFLRHFKWVLVSRDEFERLLRVEPDTLTDIQRATRFYYLQKTSFGAMRQSFGTSTLRPPRVNLNRIEEELSAVHLRLAQVSIERKDWRECLETYDRPHTLFYLDPPYYGVEDYYGRDVFARADFAEMAERLAELEGKFILSLNDRPEVREIFAAFHQQQVTTRYSVRALKDGGKGVKELLISNVALSEKT